LSRNKLAEEEAMDHPIPDVPVTVTIVVVAVAVVFTVWIPVIMYRAATRHGRSTRDSLRLAGALMVMLMVWFALSAGFTQVEAFHDGPDQQPWLIYFFFLLIIVGPIAVARWSSLEELLADRRTLAELLISQTAR
jgi:Na+/proline symporter